MARTISPDVPGFHENQVESEPYLTLVYGTGAYDDGSPCFVSRWRLTPEERERVAKGEDLFLWMLTRSLIPQKVTVGVPDEWTTTREVADADQ